MKVVVSVAGTYHAPHLCFQLQKRQMLKFVFTTTPKGKFRARANIDTKSIRWVPFPELFSVRVPTMLKIPTSLYKGSPYLHATVFDKYVSHSIQYIDIDLFVSFASCGLDGIRMCKAKGITTVVERGSAHTLVRKRILDEEYEKSGIKNSPKSFDQRIIDRELLEYEISDYIVVPSHFAEKSFIDMGIKREKIIRIPYGVDLSRFFPSSDKGSRKFKILTVGNLGVEKGTGYLLDSINLLRGIEPELLLIGKLDTYIKSRLRQQGTPWAFMGPVQQQYLQSIYNSASVYCLLSVQEGMSMTILEAMACGLPVIASLNTGAEDIISDGVDGFLVPIRNPEVTAEKLLLLYSNPEFRKEMGVRARKRALDFSWDNYGDLIQQEYLRIKSKTSTLF